MLESKIFTASNADENGEKGNLLIKDFIKKRKNNSIFLPSMGNVNYLSILKYVDGVIGNSSSGIYEVPSFKKPTVNPVSLVLIMSMCEFLSICY